MGSTAIDLSHIAKLTNFSDINRLLHETVAKERGIDADVDRQLAKRGDLERELLLLNTATSEALELVRADSEALLGSVAGTATLAQRISAKVRRLDAAQLRVSSTLELIQLILERTRCVSGVQEALAHGAYEEAAECVATFLDLEGRLSAAARSMDGTGQVEEQRQLLMGAKAQLEAIVAQKLAEGAAARDHAAVLRFVKLHRPLGNPAAGLAKYIDYSRSVIAAGSRLRYNELSAALEAPGAARGGGAAGGAGAATTLVGALTALFREIAMALEADEETIRSTFGPEAVMDVALGLHAECDAAGSRLLARLGEHRRLGRVVADARKSGGVGSGAAGGAAGGGGSDVPDPRKVEPLIQELVLLVQRSEEYGAFMLTRMRDAAAAATAAAQQQLDQQEDDELRREASAASGSGGGGQGQGQQAGGGGGGDWAAAAVAAAAAAASNAAARLAQAEAAYRSGAFSVGVRELLGQYVALEEFYVEESVGIAIRIDQLSPGSLTSSMVDDAFFILKKCGSRALSTGSVQCAAALLGQVNDLLANQLRAALVARITGGPGRLLAAVGGGGGGPGGADSAGGAGGAGSVDHAAAINNADVAAEYVAKLRCELEAYADAVFAATSTDRERVRSVLGDLSKTGGEFRGLATKALEALADASLPRLRPVLEEAGAASYALSEADYSGSGIEGTWVAHLLAMLDAQLRPLRPLLTQGAWEGLFHALLDKLLVRLEVLLGRKQFTQLGGLQLDRDVRALVGALGEMTTRTVRDKVSRLTQMASLLSLEAPEELLDYWGETSWRLTPAEVRTVLGQRADFSKDAIAALPL